MKRIPRPTLLERLHTPTAQIVALIAPRGYGKTSLLQDAIKDGGLYLSAADAGGDALNIATQLAAQLPQTLHSQFAYTQSHTFTPLSAAAALRSDLAQHAPLTIALDDLQVLNEQARVFLVDYLLPRLPTGIRVLLGMRADHHLRLTSLGLKVKVVTLTHADLALSAEEGEQLGLSPEQYEATEGWPELSLCVQRGGDATQYVLDHTSSLPPELSIALRRASLLSIWRRQDRTHTQLGLPVGWLDAVREYVPCIEVVRGEYVPHTFFREVLLQELEARPDEYRAAKQALGQAWASTQPVQALEALMEAQAYDEACALVASLATRTRFRTGSQIADLLPTLTKLQDRLTPDLNVIYGIALFETGRTAQAFQQVEQAIHQGASPGSAYLTLARLRARNGNLTLARSYYHQALKHQVVERDALDIRAQLAFNQALQARNGLVTSLLDIEAEAQHVLDAGHQASPTATLLALTACTLALALRGKRDAAHITFGTARDLSPNIVDPDEFSVAATALAQFAADSGDLLTAQSLLDQATIVSPQHGQTPDRHLQLSLTTCWILLRTVDPTHLRRATFEARLARSTAQQLNDTPQRLEALVLSAICLIFQIRHHPAQKSFYDTELRQVLEELAVVASPYSSYQDTVLALREMAQITAERPFKVLRLGLAVPPNVQMLVTLLLHARGPASQQSLVVAELENLRERWGNGILQAYASWLGVTLPARRPILQLQLLTSTPYATVNGQPLRISGSAVQLLAALVYYPRVDRTHIAKIFGATDDDKGLNLLRVTSQRLKTALKTLTPLTEPLGTERGTYSLNGFIVRTDIDRLYTAPVRELSAIYLAPVLGNMLDVELVHVWQEQCRGVVQRRVNELHATDPQLAAYLAHTLSERDPYLRYADPLTAMFASTRALPRPADGS